MTNNPMRLEEALLSSDKLQEGNALYMGGKGPWTLGSECAILDPEDSPDPGVVLPQLAVQNKLRFIMFVESLHDIVINAREQIPEASISQLLEAFNYYCENDAFMEF
ncbi:MAG TPA: hypothetical protein VEK08_18400 [Planctomycetota bacterium]|nr:hypothetical protein [Planctomycetota bacterium]